MLKVNVMHGLLAAYLFGRWIVDLRLTVQWIWLGMVDVSEDEKLLSLRNKERQLSPLHEIVFIYLVYGGHASTQTCQHFETNYKDGIPTI